MTKYLNEKYGQEFEVGPVKLTSASIGINGIKKATAHPKSNNNDSFEITRVNYRDQKYSDTFLNKTWTMQAKKEFDLTSANSFSNIKSYQLKITPHKRLYLSLDGKTPTYEEMVLKNPDQLSYELIVNSSTPSSPNEPSELELNRAFTLLELVKSKNTEDGSLSYFYTSPDSPSPTYRIYVHGEELNNITSADQLAKYFAKIN